MTRAVALAFVRSLAGFRVLCCATYTKAVVRGDTETFLIFSFFLFHSLHNSFSIFIFAAFVSPFLIYLLFSNSLYCHPRFRFWAPPV
jgi:hypothetical protein